MTQDLIEEIEVTVGPHGLKGTLSIPHRIGADNKLNNSYAPPTTKAALILHGQGGHRNYCYQRSLAKALAKELGIYSLRIDFRGCGSSPDSPDPVHEGRILENDVIDIQHSAEFLISGNNPLKIKFSLCSVIAHSRGSVAMFLWAMNQNKLLTTPHRKHEAIIVPSLVNCSSRFNSKTVYDRYPAMDDNFDGLYQTCLRHGEMSQVWVSAKEIHSLATPNMEIIADLSREFSVLSIYGLNDQIIPIEDSSHFANCLNRGKHSHKLKLIPGADHNFYGTYEIKTEQDRETYNPENLPLKNGVVNYNPKVVKLILEYLSPEQEFERFFVLSQAIGHVSRWKTVEGVSNFRDIGGWNVTEIPKGLELPLEFYSDTGDKYVRPGIIYRCANTVNITEYGLKALNQLQVRTIFDLRSEGECRKDGIPSGLEEHKITRVHAPVFAQDDYSPQAIAIRYSNLMTSWYTYVHVYDKLLIDAIPTFTKIFEYIRDEIPKGGSILYHCTAGKDRTGVLTMLVLLLCGVDKHTVAKEYELTTFGFRPDHAIIKKKFLESIEKLKLKMGDANSKISSLEEMMKQGRDEWTIEVDGFNNLISSRYEAMLSTIELFNSKYGGIVNYMKEYLKFSNQDLVKIYSNLVDRDNVGGFENTNFVKWDHKPTTKSKM